YYMPLMDDDSVPANFMKRLRSKGINSSIIIVSCTRGHKPPRERRYMTHGVGDLIASRSNMKPGGVTYCQQIFKGSILKKIRYNESPNVITKPSGDGLMAQFLVTHYNDIKYVPDLFVRFNYLEKGRYMIKLS